MMGTLRFKLSCFSEKKNLSSGSICQGTTGGTADEEVRGVSLGLEGKPRQHRWGDSVWKKKSLPEDLRSYQLFLKKRRT